MPLIIQVTINEGSNKKTKSNPKINKTEKEVYTLKSTSFGTIIPCHVPYLPQVLQTYGTKKTLWNKSHLITSNP
jgi:hypothetical protein